MCVWDFNNAFDNYQENEISHRMFYIQDGLWYDMLFKDEEFAERVINRYYELEKEYLKAARREYFDVERNKRQRGDIYITQIIDEEMKADDRRLR